MSREQDLNRNEQASPHKLSEAKKRGSVAKSADAMSLSVILVATVACFALAMPAARDLARLMAHSLAVSPAAFAGTSAAALWLSAEVVAALRVLAPLLFALCVAVVLMGLLQARGVFSFTPLKPDLKRLNPLEGFKRFFSVRLLYEAGKSTLKLLVLAGVAYLALSALGKAAAHMVNMPGKTLLFEVIGAAGGVVMKLCAALALFAAVDLIFTHWDFLRSLRMSKREVEDEHKHREGDPRIKHRLRELRQEFLKRTRAVAKVPSASVLITNPTHIAVALRYEHGTSPAPQVVAKGAGRLAARMREVAHRNQVPIVQNPVLARALFKEVESDAYLPERWYPQVAKILVWLQAAQKQAADMRTRGQS